jgi:hypothetical protein
MRRVNPGRTRQTDLLARPPWIDNEPRTWVAPVIDPVAQLEELADLRNRGLLSTQEFEEQKAKVLHPHLPW